MMVNILFRMYHLLIKREIKFFGKTYRNEYFHFNSKNKKLNTYKTKNELFENVRLPKLRLKKAMTFYTERRNELAGIYFIFVGIITVVVATLFVWILKRLINK